MHINRVGNSPSNQEAGARDTEMDSRKSADNNSRVEPPASDAALSAELLQALVGCQEATEVLAVLTEALDGMAGIGGVLVNLHDPARRALVCRAARLPAPFQDMEGPLTGFRSPLDRNDPITDTFRSGEVRIMDETTRHLFTDTLAGHFRQWNIPRVAALPLTGRDHPLGTVLLLGEPGLLDELPVNAALDVMAKVAPQLELAIIYQRVRAGGDSSERLLDEQRRFLDFMTEVNNLTDTTAIFEAAAAEFFQRHPFDLVGFLEPEDNALAVRHLTVRDQRFEGVKRQLDEFYEHTRYWLGSADGATPLAYLQRTSFYFPDVRRVLHLPMSEKDSKSLELMGNPRTFLITPILRRGEPVGVLWLMSLDEVFELSETEQRLIEQLSAFLGTTLINAEMYSSLQRQRTEVSSLNSDLQRRIRELDRRASRDSLTGLLNYGSFEERLTLLIDAHQRDQGGSDLSLLVVDIDHFKRFNDTFGHEAGNQVLREVAHRLQSCIRDMDTAYRYGGEEFVAILPRCDVEGARVIGERIRYEISRHRPEVEGAPAVTVSVGYAAHKAGESGKELFKRADQALYRAKGDGRDRVVGADE